MKAVSKLNKVIIFSVVFCVLLVLIFLGLTEHKMSQTNLSSADNIIEVKKGTSFNKFARQLQNLGIVEQTIWLKIYVKLNPRFSQIKAGNYQVSAEQRIKDILFMITQGQEYQYKITFVEGSTLKQWLNQLKVHPNIVKTLDYQKTNTLYQQVADALALTIKHPEGLFFPETYAFTHNTQDIELLKRAYVKMQTHLAQAWENRQGNLPYKNQYEALIMASIIEKESGQHAEHQVISSVFVNRLAKNMRLQTDPTIIYGLGERYQGDIKREHKREKTAYNTYRINGLPPTPIAMPGMSAILATMHPAQTNYYYFVSDGSGKHIFSTTLKEHNKAVVKYQLNQ